MKTTNAYPTADGTVRLGQSVKIKFPAKPPSEIITCLKENGFSFFYDTWSFEAANQREALTATQVGLKLGCYLDLVGQLYEDTPEKIAKLFATKNIKCIFDTPRFLRNEYKSYILFESLKEVSEWMTSVT